MRKKKALLLTLWAYTFLLWLYISARITFSRVPVYAPFVNGVPFLSFLRLGALTFVASMVLLYLYLTQN